MPNRSKALDVPSIHLKDALAAILRSEHAGEDAFELRAAVRALIQHVEELERRVAAAEAHARSLDERTIGSVMLG